MELGDPDDRQPDGERHDQTPEPEARTDDPVHRRWPPSPVALRRTLSAPAPGVISARFGAAPPPLNPRFHPTPAPPHPPPASPPPPPPASPRSPTARGPAGPRPILHGCLDHAVLTT